MHEWFHLVAQGSDGVAKDLAPENAATTKKRVCIWTAMTNRGRELRPVAGQSSIISNGNIREKKTSEKVLPVRWEYSVATKYGGNYQPNVGDSALVQMLERFLLPPC